MTAVLTVLGCCHGGGGLVVAGGREWNRGWTPDQVRGRLRMSADIVAARLAGAPKPAWLHRLAWGSFAARASDAGTLAAWAG